MGIRNKKISRFCSEKDKAPKHIRGPVLYKRLRIMDTCWKLYPLHKNFHCSLLEKFDCLDYVCCFGRYTIRNHFFNISIICIRGVGVLHTNGIHSVKPTYVRVCVCACLRFWDKWKIFIAVLKSQIFHVIQKNVIHKFNIHTYITYMQTYRTKYFKSNML